MHSRSFRRPVELILPVSMDRFEVFLYFPKEKLHIDDTKAIRIQLLIT